MSRTALVRLALLTGAAALMGACASTQYAYAPAEKASVTPGGQMAARYEIPAGQPQGDVRVLTSGVVDLQSEGDGKLAALHVRVVLAKNTGTEPWRVDTRNLALVLEGGRSLRPFMVNADAGRPPVLSVPTGQQRTVDLYFPLPEGVTSNEELPAFSLRWQVQTDDQVVAELTPFERLKIEQPADETTAGYGYDYGYPYGSLYPYDYGFGPYTGLGFGVGLGPVWWYNPIYPRAVVVRRPFVVRPRGHVGFWHGSPALHGRFHGGGFRGHRVHAFHGGHAFRGGFRGHGGHAFRGGFHGGAGRGFHGGGFHGGGGRGGGGRR